MTQTSFDVRLGNEVRTLPILILADLGIGDRSFSFTIDNAKEWDRFFAALGLELSIDVASVLGGEPRIRCTLPITSMADFRPEAVASAVSDLTAVRDLIFQVEQAARGKSNSTQLSEAAERCQSLPAVRDAFDGLISTAPRTTPKVVATPEKTAPSATATPSVNSAVDRILGMVDDPKREEKARSAIGSIVKQVTSKKTTAGSRPSRDGFKRLAAKLKSLFCDQLDAIYRDVNVRRAEAFAYGLRFLVKRGDFRKGFRIEIAHAALDSPDCDKQELASRVIRSAGQPPIAILAPTLFDDPSMAAETLRGLADAAAELQTPLIASVGRQFFGDAFDAGMLESASSADLERRFEGDRYAAFQTLRATPNARWVSVAFNRFQGREPHSERAAKKQYYSECRSESDPETVLCDPVWAIGALIARSHGKCGWPTEISGEVNGQVDDLPVRELSIRGQQAQIPLEVLATHQHVQSLSRCGILALGCRHGVDAAFVVSTPSLKRPEPDDRNHICTLQFELLVSRVRTWLESKRPAFSVGPNGTPVVELEQLVGTLLADTGPGHFVDVTLRPNGSGAERVATIRFRTGRGVLGGIGAEFEFSI